MNCITNMKEKKMSNLSEEIINRYLTGQCSEEELIEVNAWMKESEENARQLFRMEEIYHLGKFDQYTDEQQILRAEKQLYKKLDEAIQAVGKAEGVVYIFDLARTPIPYVGAQSVDVTAKVKTQLGIK